MHKRRPCRSIGSEFLHLCDLSVHPDVQHSAHAATRCICDFGVFLIAAFASQVANNAPTWVINDNVGSIFIVAFMQLHYALGIALPLKHSFKLLKKYKTPFNYRNLGKCDFYRWVEGL
jgi:hypothetical protein